MQFYIDSFDNINIDKLYYWKHWFIHLNIISWKEWKTSFLRWIVLGITVNSPNGWMEGPLKDEAKVVLSHSRMLSVLHWNSTNHKTFPPVECWSSFISTLQGSRSFTAPLSDLIVQLRMTDFHLQLPLTSIHIALSFYWYSALSFHWLDFLIRQYSYEG